MRVLKSILKMETKSLTWLTIFIEQALLALGATVDARNSHQQTALMFASAKGHLPIVKVCILYKLDGQDSIVTDNVRLFLHST